SGRCLHLHPARQSRGVGNNARLKPLLTCPFDLVYSWASAGAQPMSGLRPRESRRGGETDMFRLLLQQRYPWIPGSFVLTVILLSVLGRLLPAPYGSGHFSGGALTIELGAVALGVALAVGILALVRQPGSSPFARIPSTRLTRARVVQ